MHRRHLTENLFKFTRRPHPGKGKLSIGVNVSIGNDVEIDLTGNVILEKHVEISGHVKIFTHKHHWNHSIKQRAKIQKIEIVDLTISKDAFIGTNAILIGIKNIGKGAIIGAGAVITKDVPAYEVWAGNPAKKIGERRDEIE